MTSRSKAAMRTRERLMLAVIVVLVVAGLVWYFGRGSASGGDDPYADVQAHGTITFYDASGNVETHGSIDTRPFAAKAVSSVPAAPPYNVTGAKATLVAYQPREGVTAPYWSGDTMTASTTYADFSHPRAVGTAADFSLADFLSEFPTRWDGAIEMRIYLGAPGQSTLNSSYPVADIKVTGNTWTLVQSRSSANEGGS